MRKQYMRRTTILLGRQVARDMRRSRKGRRIWEQVAGDPFATLFPDLCGQSLTVDTEGVDLAGKPRLLLAFLWLQGNGYV